MTGEELGHFGLVHMYGKGKRHRPICRVAWIELFEVFTGLALYMCMWLNGQWARVSRRDFSFSSNIGRRFIVSIIDHMHARRWCCVDAHACRTGFIKHSFLIVSLHWRYT